MVSDPAGSARRSLLPICVARALCDSAFLTPDFGLFVVVVYFMCIGVFPACESVHHVHNWKRARRGHWVPGTGVRMVVTHHVGVKN